MSAVRLEDARRVIAAAEKKAKEIGQPMNIAIADEGGNIVAHEYTDNHAVDFSTQITKIKGTNADLILFGGLDNQAAGFARRMKQLGVNAQLVGGGGVMDQTEQVSVEGADTPANGWTTQWYGGSSIFSSYHKACPDR